jgi:glycosyltransferase involved in cell wall biosynthesis
MAEKKRILFISHHGTMSGAPISLLTLMKYFAANRDWEFQVLMRKEGPLRSEFEKLAPTHVYYQHFLAPADMRPEGAKRPPLPKDVRRRKFRQWRHEQRLRLILKQFNPDLVYSNTTVNGDLLAKLHLKKPTLIHVRELWTTVALYNQVQLDAFKHPDYKYFAVSEFVRKYLEDTFSIPLDRIGIVPGSMEPEVFDEKAKDLTLSEMRKELSLPEKAMIIGGLGSVDSRKGVDYFVDTALDVLQSDAAGPPVYFVWIGDGGMRQEMLEKVVAAGFAGRVVFPGARKNPYPYLQLFDIGLMTSRDDPFPRSVMEMAAFGAPIICFRDSGGAAEFVQDDAGIVVENFSAADMADAVRSMLGNGEEKAAFAIAARRKAREDYETSRIGESAARLLDRMLESKRASG